MWQLLSSLVNSFLLVRDLFGYLLPGALFVLGVIYACSIRYPSLAGSVTHVFADTPKWLLTWYLVGASYVIGHVLVAVGYQLYDWYQSAARAAGLMERRKFCASASP